LLLLHLRRLLSTHPGLLSLLWLLLLPHLGLLLSHLRLLLLPHLRLLLSHLGLLLSHLGLLLANLWLLLADMWLLFPLELLLAPSLAGLGLLSLLGTLSPDFAAGLLALTALGHLLGLFFLAGLLLGLL